MTHAEILIRELQARGRLCYRDLTERYEDQGYTYFGFVAAAHKLRRRGVLAPVVPGSRMLQLADASVCPCCGRAL